MAYRLSSVAYSSHFRGLYYCRSASLHGPLISPLPRREDLPLRFNKNKSFLPAFLRPLYHSFCSSYPFSDGKKLVSSSPWLMLPSSDSDLGTEVVADQQWDEYCFYRLKDQKIITLKNKQVSYDNENGCYEYPVHEKIPEHAMCVGSSHGWLAYASLVDGSFFLTNPVVCPARPSIMLPPTTKLPAYLMPSYREGEHVVRDRRSFGHTYIPGRGNVLTGANCKSVEKLSNYFIRKVIMSGDPGIDNEKDAVVVMAIQGERNELAFCKPGDKKWTDLEDQKLGEYGDIAYSHRDQLFYALKLDGNELEGWDLKDPSSPKRIEFGNKTWRSLMIGLTYYQRRLRDAAARAEYVLESPFGDKRLLVVHRFTNLSDDDDETFETWSFDVYEVDLETKAWVRLKSLGNCVLFLGCNQSFSLSATDFPELRPNSIYFTGDFNHIFRCAEFSFPDSYYRRVQQPPDAVFEGCDMGVYHLEDCSITPHYDGCHQVKKTKRPLPIWVTPKPC
ncbi:hypothetical protein RJ639_024523 [Escallonia herrerae]|uniref:KIB1-4 beta-propeller domain-containing protein n=1 Tax=Escallonia herrerae TaxID=1293975 RepID=A0AA88UYW4_9ASTE|nr:hypothetical protein RJ639_024523 [Escallonia herrerae]